MHKRVKDRQTENNIACWRGDKARGFVCTMSREDTDGTIYADIVFLMCYCTPDRDNPKVSCIHALHRY